MVDNTVFLTTEENKKFELLLQDAKKLSISLKNYTEDIRKNLNISENLKYKIEELGQLNNSILKNLKKVK